MATQRLQPVLLLPVFFTVESARAALWAARAAYDCDGGLLCTLFALVVGILGVVPSPVWTIVMYAARVAWVPVHGVLWMWGIGRGSLKKRYPTAVTRWYAYARARRAETLRQRRRQYGMSRKTHPSETMLE